MQKALAVPLDGVGDAIDLRCIESKADNRGHKEASQA
jgi:hypothetical protein